ncbi:rCG36169 [Rattus norvegicus]|uniref:RCG36169 n=1 Tax=Rattus norvegicus TaxID=10116 RepID=A6IJM4_RAT|nr:rCG36169 [Rattus norvegicus]
MGIVEMAPWVKNSLLAGWPELGSSLSTRLFPIGKRSENTSLQVTNDQRALCFITTVTRGVCGGVNSTSRIN